MTFLAVSSQKSLLTLQQSQLEFEQVLVTNQVNWCKKQMDNKTQEYAELQEQYEDYPDVDTDPYYIQLQQMDEQLQTRQSSLDDQIALMKQEITSFKTMVQNNIKSDCGLNLIGG